MDASRLRALSPTELAECLRNQDPCGDASVPDRDGMAKVLEEMVTASPTRFLAEADAFLDLPVLYVEALLRGLQDVEPEDAELDWGLVVRLVSNIVAAHRRDPAWRVARRECIGLLWLGLRDRAVRFGLRESVWAVIDSLCDDDEPSLEDDAESATDVVANALRRVRAQALRMVLEYGLWVRACTMSPLRMDRQSFGMESIPEVRLRLERHLDPELEPSSTVRAVYGMWFPYLCRLDEEWTLSNVERIFPDASPGLRDAAWESYLSSCPVYTTVFALLRPQYAAAVQRLAEPRGRPAAAMEDAGVHLGQHLLLAAGEGALSWSGDGDLIGKYFACAGSDHARKAVLQVGRLLSDGYREFRPETVYCLGQLADALLDMLEGDRDGLVALRALGSWIASGRFEVPWALRRLRRLMVLAGTAEPTLDVMGYLMDLAEEDAAESFRVVRFWADPGGTGRAFADGRLSGLLDILRAALEDDSVSGEARNFIARLGAAGHVEYRDLLEPRPRDQSR